MSMRTTTARRKNVGFGLVVPETRAQKFSKAGTTLFSKRFDRVGSHRIHYASAMTMLGATDGEDGHSYLEIAEWICANSADVTYYRLTRSEAQARYSEMKKDIEATQNTLYYCSGNKEKGEQR